MHFFRLKVKPVNAVLIMLAVVMDNEQQLYPEGFDKLEPQPLI